MEQSIIKMVDEHNGNINLTQKGINLLKLSGLIKKIYNF